MTDQTGEDSDRCVCDFLKKRSRLLKLDRNFAVGSHLKLTEREKVVNDYLMKFKYEEMDKGFIRPERFLAANHFFKIKKRMERSKVFQFIKAMPKGSSLHSHDTGMVSADFLYTLTFKENLYGLVKDDALILQFFSARKVPKDQEWTLVSELRETDPDFDEFLKSRLTLIRENPEVIYPDVNTVWTSFQNLFINLEKLITYKPVFQEYFYQVLKEAYEENVKYVEFRGYLPTVYDIDGTTYKNADVVGLYWETLTQFMCDHVDFVGCKFIFAPHRMVDSEGMDEYVKIFKLIYEKYPRFVVGFDLVGQEDLGAPLINFIDQMIQLQEFGCKFFFHAGETHWNGQPTDLNLFDAIMLNTVRIGHGFALLKHPLAANLVRERGIAIEISPISNQVLKLIDDVRDHPAAIMIANNYPVVIVSDDPSFWGAKGISYDWYMTFMGMCHRDADIRLLKQLALNSIEYTGLDEDEKEIAFKQFECDWNKFLTRVLRGCECGASNKDCVKP